MRTFKFVLYGLNALLVLVVLRWSNTFVHTGGHYMIEHFLIMRNGLTTVGTIENVRANPEILIPGNYLANVSYVTKTGETFKRDFRYGLPTFDSTSKVNVVYRNSNPQEAFLKEDGGYFQGSLTGLGIFIGFFSFIALLLFALKKWILGCKPEVR